MAKSPFEAIRLTMLAVEELENEGQDAQFWAFILLLLFGHLYSVSSRDREAT
jgi:hypothetical protein